MGRGGNTEGNTAVASRAGAVAHSKLSIAQAFPMNAIMEEIAERLKDADGGVECPKCENFYPAQGAGIPERYLLAECPVHGRFNVDVSDEYDDIFSDLCYNSDH